MVERLKLSLKLLKGKIRRFYLGHFRKSYVKLQLEKRKGECARCGACCKLIFNCPFLIENPDGTFKCKIYGKRPINCRIFPIDEKDLKERNLISNLPCGYYFESSESKQQE